MVAAKKPSANESANDLILVHTVQLKPMIKAQISGRMVSSSISDVAIASVHSEKTRLKKLMMISISIIARNDVFLAETSNLMLYTGKSS